MRNRNPNHTYKICHLGPMGSGKTQFINTLISPLTFETNAQSTIGANVRHTKLKTESEQNPLELSISHWDISGDPRLRQLSSNYFRNADAFILHFDITDKSSLAQTLQKIAPINRLNNTIKPLFFLIGNKSDLNDLRQISLKEAKQTAEDHGIIFLGECSAKDNINIQNTIQQIVQQTKQHLLNETPLIRSTIKQQPKKKKSPLGLQLLFGASLALLIAGITFLAWPAIIAIPFISPIVAAVTIGTIGGALSLGFAAVMKKPASKYLNPGLETSQNTDKSKHYSPSTANLFSCLKIGKKSDFRAREQLNEFSDPEDIELQTFDRLHSNEKESRPNNILSL